MADNKKLQVKNPLEIKTGSSTTATLNTVDESGLNISVSDGSINLNDYVRADQGLAVNGLHISGKINSNEYGHGLLVPNTDSWEQADKTISVKEDVDLKADKVGPLPKYTANTTDNIYDFIHNNDLEAKRFILDITNFYKGVICFVQYGQPGTPHISFDFVTSGDHFSASNVEAGSLTFSQALSSTYCHDYELQDNKVTLGSTNTTDEYPNAKSVWDECQNIRLIANDACNTFVLDYTQTIARAKTSVQSYGSFKFWNKSTNQWEDKRTELLNGDYDNLEICNSQFNSTVDELTITSQNYHGYIICGVGPWFYVIQTALGSGGGISEFPIKVGDQIKIINKDIPDRWFISTSSSYGKLKADENSQLIKITWAELKALRDNSQLIPGSFYRITDYTCTTTQANTSSAGHVFDIIVRADSINKLNEVASAIQHEGDTYFANSNLSAWKLWYCLDNDTSRFAWADATNGKGIIYRMIDEFGNDAPYDFKNILFTKSGSYTNAYTFSYRESNTIKDASVFVGRNCYNNVIKKRIVSSEQYLNFNVFYSTSSFFSFHSNTFGDNCHSNTFNGGCEYNTFGNYCANNIFGTNCNSNILGNHCHYNIFGNECIANTFGNDCSNNTFGKNCYYSIFGNNCNYIKFGATSTSTSYYQHNIIDSGCSYLYLEATGIASSSNQLQNIHIHSGVSGTSSSSSYKAIAIDRGLAYTTDIYPVGSTEMFR